MIKHHSNLKTIDQRVEAILVEFPKLAKLPHKKRLVWYYWTKYDGLKESMEFDTFAQLTDEESIVRSRRKYIEDTKTKEIRALQEQWKNRDHYNKTKL